MNSNPIANGLPMSIAQMREYLQQHYEKPVALREQGDTSYKCPYCKKTHNTDPGPGYFETDCDDADRYEGIVIGDRMFVTNYGVMILEYVINDDGVYMLTEHTPRRFCC